jgi:hypothetical protein
MTNDPGMMSSLVIATLIIIGFAVLWESGLAEWYLQFVQTIGR